VWGRDILYRAMESGPVLSTRLIENSISIGGGKLETSLGKT